MVPLLLWAWFGACSLDTGEACPEHLCLSQSVMNKMHVISIPYALMKVNPLSWIQKVCLYKGKGISIISRFVLH